MFFIGVLMKKIIFILMLIISSIASSSEAKIYYYEELEGLINGPEDYPFNQEIVNENALVNIMVDNSVMFPITGEDISLIATLKTYNIDNISSVKLSYSVEENDIINTITIDNNDSDARTLSIIKKDDAISGSVNVEISASIGGTVLDTKSIKVLTSGNCPSEISIDTTDETDALGNGHNIYCDADNNYLISSESDLIHISNNQITETIGNLILSGSYKVTNNITMTSSESFTPIGSSSSAPFTGTFDGDGYAISNLYINSSIPYAGLIGRASATSQIKNLALRNINITGGDYTGGVVGYNLGNISNVLTTGSVIGTSYVGGVVGFNNNNISYSYSNATVQATSLFTGGLIGRSDSGIITDSYASFTTAPSGGGYVGGLIGYIQSTTVNNYSNVCEYINENKTSCSEENAMLIQSSWDYSIWKYEENYNLYLRNELGGDSEDVSCNLEDPLGDMDQDGNGYYLIGGSSGNAELAFNQLKCLSSAQNISGNEAILTSNYKLTTNIDMSSTIIWRPIGNATTAFSGIFDGDGYAISNLTVNSDASYVGLFGKTSSAAEVRNLALRNVNITGGDCIGGVVGHNLGNISNVLTTGSVIGTSYVGGVVGLNNKNISYSYSNATVQATSFFTGGLIGRSNGGTITESYASFTTAPSGEYYNGGLIGYIQSTTVNNYSNVCEYTNENKTSCSEENAVLIQASWDYSIWKYEENYNLHFINETGGSATPVVTIDEATALDTSWTVNAGETISFPFNNSYTGKIDWGDGSIVQEYDDLSSASHTYTSAGTYTILMNGDWGSTTEDAMNGDWGTSFSYMFAGQNVPSDMDISNWNVSNITTMEGMFHNATLPSNLDLSSWNTSAVTNMSHMFHNTNIPSSIGINSWDVSSVKTMYRIFASATIPSGFDISNWDVSGIMNISSIFDSTNIPAGINLSSWDVSNANDVIYMLKASISGNITYNTTMSSSLYSSFLQLLADTDVALPDSTTNQEIVAGSNACDASDTDCLDARNTIEGKGWVVNDDTDTGSGSESGELTIYFKAHAKNTSSSVHVTGGDIIDISSLPPEFSYRVNSSYAGCVIGNNDIVIPSIETINFESTFNINTMTDDNPLVNVIDLGDGNIKLDVPMDIDPAYLSSYLSNCSDDNWLYESIKTIIY